MFLRINRLVEKKCVIKIKINFLIFHPKHVYVLKRFQNRLNETVLFEHPKHMLKLMDWKILTILC